ncbi:hypothetical protein INR49_032251 [Caranx melampygus]|nr:hypothetical protein INR49_032251 [Caranx melampygus]
MAGSSITPLSRTSTPPADPFYHSSNPAGSPRLAVARLSSAFLSSGSGKVPLSVNGTGGGSGGTAPHTECKMVEVHGVNVASFTVNGEELICLPQVFELFLKHLVGGLHTVYTKLKRLDISPVVCTVEQVRVLRGLGAIQPGVNRCKLITRADFETLYRDCTNASNQQQYSNGAESENDNTGGSEGSWEKERRLLPPPSSVVATAGSASLHLSTLQEHNSLLANRLSDIPFMVMPHALLPVGLPLPVSLWQ